MTIEEYLKTVNGLSADQELTPDLIRMIGFVDIIPNIDRPLAASPVTMDIVGGDIVVKRTFTTATGDVPMEKTISLSDDISQYQGDYASTEDLLASTIKALKDIQDENLLFSKNDPSISVDYQQRIDELKKALEKIKGNGMGL